MPTTPETTSRGNAARQGPKIAFKASAIMTGGTVGRTVSQTSMLTNTGSSPRGLLNVTPGPRPSAFTITGNTCASPAHGKSCTLTGSFALTFAGTAAATLSAIGTRSAAAAAKLTDTQTPGGNG
jgi:hypothetical protein